MDNVSLKTKNFRERNSTYSNIFSFLTSQVNFILEIINRIKHIAFRKEEKSNEEKYREENNRAAKHRLSKPFEYYEPFVHHNYRLSFIKYPSLSKPGRQKFLSIIHKLY